MKRLKFILPVPTSSAIFFYFFLFFFKYFQNISPHSLTSYTSFSLSLFPSTSSSSSPPLHPVIKIISRLGFSNMIFLFNIIQPTLILVVSLIFVILCKYNKLNILIKKYIKKIYGEILNLVHFYFF